MQALKMLDASAKVLYNDDDNGVSQCKENDDHVPILLSYFWPPVSVQVVTPWAHLILVFKRGA